MITITLEQIRKHSPCAEGWKKLVEYVGNTTEQFPFSTIVKSNGVKDAIWALRCLDDKKPAQLFAVACAQSVAHLIQDPRSVEAVKAGHLCLHDEVTLAAADAVAAAAAHAAGAVAAAAAHAAYAAAFAASGAAGAAADAAADAAAEREKQAEWLIAIADWYEKD